jgi:hypothetical protein
MQKIATAVYFNWNLPSMNIKNATDDPNKCMRFENQLQQNSQYICLFIKRNIFTHDGKLLHDTYFPVRTFVQFSFRV